MNQQISRNTEEVAALPRFKYAMNLQLFAEDDEFEGLTDDEGPEDSELDQEDEEFESVDVRGRQEEEDEPEEEDADDAPEVKPEKEKQDKTTNDAFQKMRQEKEAAEKRAAEIEAKRQRDIEVARKYGAEYGIYSDEDVAQKFGSTLGISTVEQFEQQLEKEKYAAAGLPDEIVEELLESRKDRLERKRLAEAEQQKQLEKVLMDNYTELTSVYPDLVKSPDDITPEVWKAFNSGANGLSLTQVFRALNHEAIVTKTAAATKQKTLNNLNSKKHLSTQSDGAAETTLDVDIDAETMEYYKGMGLNKAQATKHHKKLYG